MSMAWAPTIGFVLALGGLCPPACLAGSATVDESRVFEKRNTHGFTITEEDLMPKPGSPGTAFLLSNCPRKGCVALSGTFTRGTDPTIDMSIEGSECRLQLQVVEINRRDSQDDILTIPPDPACADIPQEAAGRYFAFCFWDAPLGDLSWTGWHKHQRCVSQDLKNFKAGPL